MGFLLQIILMFLESAWGILVFWCFEAIFGQFWVQRTFKGYKMKMFQHFHTILLILFLLSICVIQYNKFENSNIYGSWLLLFLILFKQVKIFHFLFAEVKNENVENVGVYQGNAWVLLFWSSCCFDLSRGARGFLVSWGMLSNFCVIFLFWPKSTYIIFIEGAKGI